MQKHFYANWIKCVSPQLPNYAFFSMCMAQLIFALSVNVVPVGKGLVYETTMVLVVNVGIPTFVLLLSPVQTLSCLWPNLVLLVSYFSPCPGFD